MYSLKSSQLKCESPSIILNPHLEYLHRIGFRLSFLDISDSANVAPYASFRRYCVRLKNTYNSNTSVDNFISKYSLVNYRTCETFPLFVLVPCNHCLLCRNSKLSRWQFRAACEIYTSQLPSYFITLTYNPKFLPSMGVSLRAIQLFMKRLRIRLTRLNIEHSLKYIACGEYGKNGNRPHYHISLFDFPLSDKFPTLHSILTFIEECWSAPSGEKIGFCYVKPCDSGSVKYLLKYLLKETRSKLETDFPPFYCFSKSIGVDYLKSQFDYYKNFPEDLSISCLDIISGKLVYGTFPTYYLKKFSGIHKLFCPAIRDSMSDLFNCFVNRYVLVKSYLSKFDVLNAYPAFPPGDYDYFLSLCDYFDVDVTHLSDYCLDIPPVGTMDEFHKLYYNYCDSIEYFKYIFETNYLSLSRDVLDRLKKYNSFCNSRSLHNFYSLPEINVMSLSANKMHLLRKSLIRSIL